MIDPLVEILSAMKRQMLDALVEAMSDDCMSDAERLEILDYLESKFCLGCGRVLNGTICHCRNDE